ncbi:MATE family efflux transporter [Oceaniglobus trochenteri]|uniref:MATE family efflux transporter n=1 Tax=Oceaniglobus trochenteri TaxID=2763260 RepID=UPI001CFF587A|nr:MATE family efflux transporter [Oceaniglobus trochenteri]
MSDSSDIPLSRAGHARAILILGLPLIASHVAQFAISLTDALMLGWYDVNALAAQVLGGTMWFVLFLFGSGFAFAVMPMVAQANETGDGVQVRRVTRMGIWVSLMFAGLAVPLLLLSEVWLGAMGQDPLIVTLASAYLDVAAWGLLPALGVMVLKSYLAALERTRVVMWVTLAAVVVNVGINYSLIFGNWGAPELGITGAAIASVAVQVVSLIGLAGYARWVTPEYELFVRLWRPDWEAFGDVFRLGWPIGLTNLAEVGLFAASSVMMGWIGPIALAAHGVALQISGLMFMVHIGLSNAATVRAGQAMGRRDGARLRRGAGMAIALSMIVAVVTVILFVTVPAPLIGVFLDPLEPAREEVLAIGVGLLAAAALFQVMDAAQAMALGLLRGLQDTRGPMVIAMISYWIIGAPASYLMGFTFGLGGVGIWLGLALGLGVAGALLMARFVSRARAL